MTTAPFLERRDELAALARRLEAACRGSGGLVALSAEAGGGKGRLVEEIEWLHSKRARFLWGRSFSATSHTPYAVWVDALDAHLRSLNRREILRVIGSSSDLAGLFSAAGERLLFQAEAVKAGDITVEQTRLFAQMTALLSRLADVTPVVVVLDNLQWADKSSIELLHFAVRGLRDRRVLMVALYRPEDVGKGHALADCLSSLKAVGLAEEIALPPLGQGAAAAIIHHVAGHAWPPDAANQLHTLTQGNPLFLLEYARQAIGTAGTRSPRELLSGSLPSSIESLLRSRISKLDDDCRRVLSVASVIEANIEYQLLRAVTCFDEERLLAAIDGLIAAHLLCEAAGPAVLYEFRKPLVQAVVYGSLGTARRRYLHQLVASALMTCPAANDRAGSIARHLVASAPTDLQAKALPYLRRAAHHAMAVFGNHEAIGLISLALRVAAAAPEALVPVVELHLNLGESYKRLGKFDEAIDAWTRALAWASGEERAKLRRCIARALWQSGREREARRHLDDGVRTLPEADRAAESLWLRQERALAMVRQGEVDAARAEVDRLETLVDEEVHAEIAARVQIVKCMTDGYRGNLLAALSAGSRAVRLAAGLDYPGAVFLACYTMAALLRYDGEVDRFEALCAQCDRIARQMHAKALESWSMSLRTERYALLGRLREAIAAGESAVAIDRSIGQATILPRSHAFLAVAYHLSGDLVASRRNLAEAARLIRTYDKTELRSAAVVESAAAYLDFLDGRYDECLRRSDSLAARLSMGDPLGFYLLHPYVLPLAAEAAARLGASSRARAILFSIRNLQKGSFRPAEAAVALVTGLLALHAGQFEEARAGLDGAVKIWSQRSCPYRIARTRLDLATLAERMENVKEAVDQLRHAAQTFDAIGAARDLAMARQRLRALGARPARAVSRRATGQPITSREEEIVALLATGRTNREIAGDLFLSELTVETHVKNVLRKLGLKSRVQVAAFAIERNSRRDSAHSYVGGSSNSRVSAVEVISPPTTTVARGR